MSPQSTPALIRAFYAALGIELGRSWRAEALVRCFTNPDAHHRGDRTPSTAVNLESGAWFCHGCGASGGAYDAALARRYTPRSAMELLIRHGLAEPRRYPPASSPRTRQRPVSATRASSQTRLDVTEADIDRWARQLASHQRMLRALREQRGIAAEVLATHRVGLDRDRLTIPVQDETGPLIGLLRYDPSPERRGPKMLAAPGSRRGLFPAPETMPGPQLLLCEGEPDALAALSQRIPAVAIPGVAGWRSEWARRLQRFTVTVCMDCDPEGRSAATRIAADLSAADVINSVLDLDHARSDGHDLTDALRRGRRCAR